MDKVRFGFRNVVYAPVTNETASVITYGTVKKFAEEGAGGVSVALSPRGDSFEKNADDVVWFKKDNNQGYEGDLIMTILTDSFKKDCLGWAEDENGVLIENADAAFTPFALGFEVQGNEKATRTWYYYCVASRPNDEANTKESDMSTNDVTLSITALPRPTDKDVKATAKASDNVYSTFFDSVYEKSVS